VAAMSASPWNKVLPCSSPSRRHYTQVPVTSAWRWSPALPGPVQESGLELRRLSGDVVLSLCLQGYGVCCGSCGR
jgi:hypothetical protein